MNRAMLLREKIGKLPVILSHTGARITQEGSSPFVKCDSDGKPVLVNLPYLADDAPEELMDAIEGFLDHEVAHLMFTDFKLTQKSAAEGFGTLHGWLEDVFVERQMAKRFPGSAANLTETGRFFLSRGVLPAMAQAQAAEDPQQLTAALLATALRAWGGQQIYQDFMRPYWPLLNGVSVALGELVDAIGQCQSTSDTYVLAQKMQQVLMQMDAALFMDSLLQERDQTLPGTGRQDGQAQQAEAQQAGSQQAGSQQAARTALDQAPSLDSIMQDDEAAAGMHQAAGDAGEPAGEQADADGAKAAARLLQALGNVAGSFDDQVMKLIGSYAEDAIRQSDYLVYSTGNDCIEPLRVPDSRYRESFLQELEQDVASLCGPMQKNLERIVTARSLATWLPGRRSGRMHAANLSRLATGDDRVFRKKQEGLSRDVAVEMVVDCSGSMRNSDKIYLATQAAYALATVLERLHIANEVIGFTTSEDGLCTDHAVAAKDTFRYSRVQALYLPILKGYNERLTADVRKRFAYLPRSGIMENSVDGESIEIAARRLSGRRETGKILLVLSDGMPEAQGDRNAQRYHLKKVVEQVEASGIKVVGLGILSSSVEHYYEKHLVVHKLSDLPGEVLKQLKALIVGMQSSSALR